MALTLVMLGATVMLCVELDPMYGVGMVLLVAGTNLLGRKL